MYFNIIFFIKINFIYRNGINVMLQMLPILTLRKRHIVITKKKQGD